MSAIDADCFQGSESSGHPEGGMLYWGIDEPFGCDIARAFGQGHHAMGIVTTVAQASSEGPVL